MALWFYLRFVNEEIYSSAILEATRVYYALQLSQLVFNGDQLLGELCARHLGSLVPATHMLLYLLAD